VTTRVVLWSSELNQQVAQQATDHGVYRFLSGPLSTDELHSALYEALGRTGEPDAAPAPAAPVEDEFTADPTPIIIAPPPEPEKPAAPPPEPEKPAPSRAEGAERPSRRERVAAAA